MGGGQKGGFELGGGEVDALAQHAMKELGVPLRIGLLRRRVIDHRVFGKESSHHRPDSRLPQWDAGFFCGRSKTLGQGARSLV